MRLCLVAVVVVFFVHDVCHSLYVQRSLSASLEPVYIDSSSEYKKTHNSLYVQRSLSASLEPVYIDPSSEYKKNHEATPEPPKIKDLREGCKRLHLCTCAGPVCCTCNADVPTSCFPEDVYTLLDNGKLQQMKHLKIGQRILTVQDGKRVFSEVKVFLKRLPSLNATYLTLITDQGNRVTLSENHIIFSSTNKSTSMQPRFAQSVKPGDYLFSTLSCPDDLCPERVSHVIISQKQGAYVPVTDTGTLVVDGLLASCYPSYRNDIAHISMTLFRWFPWLLQPWQQDGFSPIISAIHSLTFVAPDVWRTQASLYPETTQL